MQYQYVISRCGLSGSGLFCPLSFFITDIIEYKLNMNTIEPISDEIVCVGGRYGDFADVLESLFAENKPIEPYEIRKALGGGDEIHLAPASNDFVPYAVGVFNQNMKRIGYVWMRQAPAIRAWLVANGLSYISGRITEVDQISKSLKIEAHKPLYLPVVDRWKKLDFNWASELPQVHAPLSDPSLTLSIMRLHDELKTATEWSDGMQLMIDNLLRALPTDLSEKRCEECVEIYHMMRRSPIEEIRRQSSYVLKVLIKEEADEHLNWWMNEWLPGYFKEVVDAGVDKMFAVAQYSLEDVERILERAPYNLFNIYKATPHVFAFRLYFSSLPQSIYDRLLTLLAVREAMRAERNRIDKVVEKNSGTPDLVKLKFFTDPCFATLNGQESLRELIKSLLPCVDEGSGRDWISLYIGYIFFKQKQKRIKSITAFFSDIDALLPGVLVKVKACVKAYDRYRLYVDPLSLECEKWFIDKGGLPPLNLFSQYRYHVEDKTQERVQLQVSDIFTRLRLIAGNY